MIESELFTKCWSTRDFESGAKEQCGDALQMLTAAVNEKIQLYPNLSDVIIKAEKTVSNALQNYLLRNKHFEIVLDQNILTQNFINIAMAKPSASFKTKCKKIEEQKDKLVFCMNPSSADAVKKASQKAIEILNGGGSGGVQEKPPANPSPVAASVSTRVSLSPASDRMSESRSSISSLSESPEIDISLASSASASPAVSDQMSESPSSTPSPFQNLPTMVQTTQQRDEPVKPIFRSPGRPSNAMRAKERKQPSIKSPDSHPIPEDLSVMVSGLLQDYDKKAKNKKQKTEIPEFEPGQPYSLEQGLKDWNEFAAEEPYANKALLDADPNTQCIIS